MKRLVALALSFLIILSAIITTGAGIAVAGADLTAASSNSSPTPTDTPTDTPTETPTDNTSVASASVPDSSVLSTDLQKKLEYIFGGETTVQASAAPIGSPEDERDVTVRTGTIPNDRPVDVLIKTASADALPTVVSDIKTDGQIKFIFADQRLVAAQVPAIRVGQLATRSDITRMALDKKVSSTSTPQPQLTEANTTQTASSTAGGKDSWGTQRVYANFVHQAGINGSGVRVAVLDNGIDPTAGMQGKIVAEEDIAPNSPIDGDNPRDFDGHGTSVAGIIAASETTVEIPTGSSDSKREIEGVAPGVSLVNGKIGTYSERLRTNNNPDSSFTVPVSQGQRVDTPVSLPTISQGAALAGRWLRVEAQGAQPGDEIRIELLNDNGQPIDETEDANRITRQVKTTVDNGNRTRIEINGTDTLLNTDQISRFDDGEKISEIRIVGESVSGTTNVEVDVELYEAGRSSSSTIAAGIYWASGIQPGSHEEQFTDPIPQSPSPPADIISLSYSAGGIDTKTNPVPEAMDAAVESGTVFVTSAGNDADQNNLVETTPVKSKTNIITVGATNRNNQRADFSQVGDPPGKFKPDVVAPGTEIPSAGPTTRIPRVPGQYNGTEIGGTSQATPHVTGIAALYYQMYERVHGEDPTPEQVRSAIIAGTTQPDFTDRSSTQSTPNEIKYETERGMGLVNAYKTYLTFTAAGTNSGETDQFTVQTPPVLPPDRIAQPNENPTLTGTLYRQDQAEAFTFEVDGTQSTEFGPIETVETGIAPEETSTFSVSRDSTGPSGDEYAVATHYPPIAQDFDGDDIEGYRFRGPLTLDSNESAAYAVPVATQLPTGTFVGDRGGIRAISYFNATRNQGDIDIRARLPQQGTTTATVLNNSTINTEQVVSRQPQSSGKVVFSADNTSGVNEFAHASNYPLFPLPSEAAVTPDRVVAGNASNPSPVSVTLSLETAGFPYTYAPFKSPDRSHFSLSVGGKPVPSDQIEFAEVAQDEYQLQFTPPTQSSAGSYDLSVGFTDTKVGISNTATATQAGAVEYTRGGTVSGRASLALIIDDSGSMGGAKIGDAKTAGSQTVALLNDQEFAAIIGFDSSARTEFALAKVANNRSAMQTAITQLDAGGGTDIGDALIEGRQQLSTAPSATTRAAILLTDGQHNGDVSPRQAAQDYARQGIPVYTIALGRGADESLLADIATTTGGESRTESDSAALSDIFADIRGTVSGTSTLQTNTGTVAGSQSVSNTVPIDQTTGTTTFRVQVTPSGSASASGSASSLPASERPRVELLYPNGTIVPYNKTASGTIVVEADNVQYSNVGGTAIYRLDDPSAGNWTYRIDNTQSQSVDYQADVTASTTTQVDVTTDATQFVNGSETTLTTTVIGGSGGVSGATVRATVTFPSGNSTTVPLTEDPGQAGKYTGRVRNSETGQATAEITVSSSNLTRQATAQWSVVSQASVLQITDTNPTTPTGPQGGTVVSEFSLSQPSTAGSSATATATAQLNESLEGFAAEAGDDDFSQRAQELAASDISLSPASAAATEFDEAVIEAARAIRSQTSEPAAAAAPQQAVSAQVGSQTQIIIDPQGLSGPNGATIPASAVQASQPVVTVPANGSATFQIVVEVPANATLGEYNGTVDLFVRGTRIETAVTVNITRATQQGLRTRIQTNSQRWQNSGPTGKQFYQAQIADQLTRLYFNSATANASSAGNPTVFEYSETPADDESVTIQPGGGVYTHQFSVETNATTGPLILGAYLTQSTDLSFESSTVVSEGSRLNVDVNVSNVTVAGDDLTRIQLTLTNRSQLQTQTDTARTLDVEMNFQVASTTTTTTTPTTTTTERIQTGGTHGQSGQVLRLEQTDITISRTVDVGGVDVPVQFTTVNARGETTVTSDDAVDAIRAFLDPDRDVDSDTAVTVIRAFLQS